VKIAFGERVLLEDFTNIVRRGEVIGLVGANGTGSPRSSRPSPARGRSKAAACGCPIRSRRLLPPGPGEVPKDKTLFDIIYDLRTQWTRAR